MLIIISLKRQAQNIPPYQNPCPKIFKEYQNLHPSKKKEKSEGKGSTRKRDRGKMKRGKGKL